MAWLRLPARRIQKKTVGCRSGSVGSLVGGYLQDPGSYTGIVGLTKVAVVCWAQRVDGWPRIETPTVKERKHEEGIVAEIAP